MSKLRIAIFLGVVLFFLYLVNAVIYEAFKTIFSIYSTGLIALGVILGILSISFIVSSLLGMRFYNWFTRIYYTLSAVWMGFAVYLFFASVIYGLLLLANIPASIVIGQILIAVAGIAGIYGIVHARSIYIKHVEVTLPNLPPVWRGKRVVFVSDLHLGQLHGSGWAQRVITKINSLQHEALFIGGDLFDGTSAPDLPALIAPLKKSQATHGTFFITGNHEEFGSNSKFIEAIRASGIRVLMNEVVSIEGLQIVGVDYAATAKKENFKNLLATLPINREQPSILLKHEPKDLDVASESGISLQLSGHTHRAQQWPLGYVARLIYKGYEYGLKRFKNMQVYTSSGAGTWGPPLRVGTDCEIVSITLIGS